VRVGLFGGSFNPIHLGHLRAAEEVREAMELDLVYFVPAASPPHKPDAGLAPSDHRLRMVQLATKGNRHFMVSDAEVRRNGPSYTVDTIRHFRSTLRAQPALFLMMGSDSFAELETWKDSAQIAQLCSLIVHSRSPAREAESSPGALAALQRFGYIRKSGYYVHPSGQTLSFVTTTFLPISASAIRDQLHNQKSARYLVPADVLDYIERHGLY
jgi:nicotinate-nucleotide adenylyltransferase